MSKTLGFAFYYCLKHPHLMESIQEEIDRETGKNDKMMNEPKCSGSIISGEGDYFWCNQQQP